MRLGRKQTNNFMRKVLFSFVLGCVAMATSAQININEEPLKTFNDGSEFMVFTYGDGDQVILSGFRSNDYKYGYGENSNNDILYIYDLSFTLKKTIDFSRISGYSRRAELNVVKNGVDGIIYASDKLFNPANNWLEFIIITEDGWVIVDENYYEIFRKTYDDFSDAWFNLLETKNGNLLEVHVESGLATKIDYCDLFPEEEICKDYKGTENEENHGAEYSVITEIYALPGYSATSLRSTTIQQLNNPYPNPAKTFIHLPYMLPEGVKEGTIRIFDSQGQLIKTILVNGNSEYVRLDTSRLPSGNYFYVLDRGEGKQFIVRK